jgi:RNA polymerase sigma-70 factor, ECF subfamily
MNHTSTDNLRLWQAIQTGDAAAFEVLFWRYRRRLIRYALPVVKQGELAEEVVNDVFVKVWEKRESLQIQDLTGYLYQMTRNASLNALKATQRRELVVSSQTLVEEDESGSKPVEPVSEDHSPLEQLAAGEAEGQIEKLMALLPAKRRLVFEMVYLQGYPVRQVSEKLGLSESTVRNHLDLGIRVLRKQFANGLLLLCLLIIVQLCRSEIRAFKSPVWGISALCVPAKSKQL